MGTQRDVAGVVACMSDFVFLREGYPALLLRCIVGLPRVCLTEIISLDSISSLQPDLEVGRTGQGSSSVKHDYMRTMKQISAVCPLSKHEARNIT